MHSTRTTLIDFHVHMGQFQRDFYSPLEISTNMHKCGVDKYVISSTTTCEGNVNRIISEFLDLVAIDADGALPCLWLTEYLFENHLDKLLNCGIDWKCIKVHPALHPEELISGGKRIKNIILLAKSLKVPLLIHTGYDLYCSAKRYEYEFFSNQDVKFILAHGRPLDQTLNMLSRYDNTMVDTAFMPIEDCSMIVECGFSDRILWGTDSFLPLRFYPKTPLIKYYADRKNQYTQLLEKKVMQNIMYNNAIKLLNL